MEVRILSGGPNRKEKIMIPMWIVELLLLLIIAKFISRTCRIVFGKTFLEILREISGGKTIKDIQKDELALDPNKLFYKLCKVSEKTPLEIFKTARTEKGFGWEDSSVERHLEMWIANGCDELPNYVESFLNDGKEYIINS